jgi:two-component system sensor histidine kinase KdpD
VAGLLAGTAMLAVLLPVCVSFRGQLSLASDVLLFLLAVVVCAMIGGFVPAVAAAVVASLLLNYYLVPHYHTLSIARAENVLALLAFVAAVLVSRVVDRAALRPLEAVRSNAEAETLATLAGSLLRGEQALPALMQCVRETFAVTSVSLLRRETAAPSSSGRQSPHAGSGLRGDWRTLASMGEDPCERPDEGDTEVAVGDDLVLVLRGRMLAAEDQRVLAAFATEVAVAYQQRQLSIAADAAADLADADRSRTALLNAVSHDLRSPLASAKAAVSGLLSEDVHWSKADSQELLENANSSLDRLTALVTNLLDMSRLQAGALAVARRPVGLDDVVSRALAGTSTAEAPIDIDVPADLPEVLGHAGLLERVIANVVENALRYNPPG